MGSILLDFFFYRKDSENLGKGAGFLKLAMGPPISKRIKGGMRWGVGGENEGKN
jgi:hypothetical protein